MAVTIIKGKKISIAVKNIVKKYCYYYLISLAITLFKRSRYSLFRYYLLPKTVPPLCIFNC